MSIAVRQSLNGSGVLRRPLGYAWVPACLVAVVKAENELQDLLKDLPGRFVTPVRTSIATPAVVCVCCMGTGLLLLKSLGSLPLATDAELQLWFKATGVELQ